jgi:hypothetical protein
MTHAELTDNLTFIAAEEMLERLVAKSVLTGKEAQLVQKRLRKQLFPTIVALPLMSKSYENSH